ncbi:MAG: hypothetical protein B7Z12_20325 [Caulobacter vibrioides]|uniref:RNA polymerase sigma factor n=1 Tax=Caulobacter vibrioides TaxID=155892 RepID=A0A258CRQ1_CAUVI|nr:MAG: hypothetical protein B7Z12_20325 [Caulobacter vibrioides]
MSLPADDAALVARAIGGDRAAFVDLFRHHGPAVAKLTRAYRTPASETEDIVQEVFLAAWRRLADYDPQRPFRAWLFAIALNRVRDMAPTQKLKSIIAWLSNGFRADWTTCPRLCGPPLCSPLSPASATRKPPPA